MSTGNMNLTLKVWRQKDNKTKGNLVDYKLDGLIGSGCYPGD